LSAYTSGWYDYREHEICLSYWQKNNRQIERVPFEWYFFLSAEDAADLSGPTFDRMIDRMEPDGNHVRVYASSDWENRRLIARWIKKNGATPLEADIAPVNRFLTDQHVKFSEHPRLLYYDFETDARSGFGKKDEHKILLVTFRRWDYENNRPHLESEYIVAKTERDLIMEFLDVVGKHDVLIAWNGGFYDEVVLKARCKRNGIYPPWKMVNFLDQMEVYKKFYQRDEKGVGLKVSFSLNAIAKLVLGKEKVDLLIPGKNPAEQFVWMYEHQRDKLIEYGLKDTDLLVELEAADNYIDALKVQSHLCNRFMSSYSLYSGYLGDAFVVRYGAEHGIRFPTKMHKFEEDDDKKADKILKKIEGAYVMEPAVGLHKEVALADFASLYPSIMRSFNISPETKVANNYEFYKKHCKKESICVAGNGTCFRTDVVGVFPAIVNVAVEKRKPFKDIVKEMEALGKEGSKKWTWAKHRSDSYKVLSNTLYGILAAMYLRYYDRECGEAVTITAKVILKMLIAKGEKEKIWIIAGDTDSVFLICNEKRLKRFMFEAAKMIDMWVESYGGTPGFIRLEMDAFYDRIFFVTKKRYAGIKKGSETPEVKGLELVRSDNCKLTRELQRRIIEYILLGEDVNAITAKNIVSRWRKHLFDGLAKVPDLVISQAVNKKLDEYKVSPVHIRIARWMLKNGHEVYQGMKIPYILTGHKDGRQVGIFADVFDGKYDAELYWKKVYPATRRVLASVFPERNWEVLN